MKILGAPENREVINLSLASKDPRYDSGIDGLTPDGDTWERVLCIPMIRNQQDGQAGQPVGVVQVLQLRCISCLSVLLTAGTENCK